MPPPCPDGQHHEGDGCIANADGPAPCPAGHHREGDQCVADSTANRADDGPAPACPAGQHPEGGKCVADGANSPPPCPAGEHREGDRCVADAAGMPKSCPTEAPQEGEPCGTHEVAPGGADSPRCGGPDQPRCACDGAAGPNCGGECADGCAAPCDPAAAQCEPMCNDGSVCKPPCDAAVHECPAHCEPNQPCRPACEGNTTCAAACESDHPCPAQCDASKPCHAACDANTRCAPACKPDEPCGPKCEANTTCADHCTPDHPCPARCEPDAVCPEGCQPERPCPPCESEKPCGPPCESEKPCGPPCESEKPCGPPCESEKPCGPPCESEGPCAARCEPEKPCMAPCDSNATCEPRCESDRPCPAADCKPRGPCGPAPCRPDAPCQPEKPDFCDDNGDGSFTCAPPPECKDRAAEGACTPPSWCKTTEDGRYHCKPPEYSAQRGDEGVPGGAPMPCGPASGGQPTPGAREGGQPTPGAREGGQPTPGAREDGNPDAAGNGDVPKNGDMTGEGDAPDMRGGPCEPAGARPPVKPECEPRPDGKLVCQPPADCGGAAFGGAGGQGCVPPDYCRADDTGAYVCDPPKDCRAGPDGGAERCFEAPSGGACEKHQANASANGAFVSCAPVPEDFCPPASPDAKPEEVRCRPPPAAPRFCGAGETPFPPDHPTRAPPVCIMPGKVEDGKYVTPGALAQGDCVMPPPGEWPPAEPAPAGHVYCPPPGFAPPPGQGDKRDDAAFAAWDAHVKDNAPARVHSYLERLGGTWANVNDSALESINKAGVVHQLFAPPAFDGRAVNGSFVESRFDDEGLGLQNFSVGGTKFFKQAKPLVEGGLDFSTATGPTVIAAGKQAVVETHNTPAGLLAYKSANAEPYHVEMELEGGFDVHDEEGVLIMQRGDWKGVFVGDARVEGGKINLSVENDRPAFFMAVPPNGLEADTRIDIAKGIQKGKVFAEMSLVKRGNTFANDIAYYADEETFDVDVTHSDADTLEIEVSGEGEGQAIVMTVDRSTLTTPLSEFALLMDGAALRECQTFEELTASAKDGGCFHIAANGTVLRVSIMPPHFSTHNFAMGSVSDTTDASASDDAAGDGAASDDAAGDGAPSHGAIGDETSSGGAGDGAASGAAAGAAAGVADGAGGVGETAAGAAGDAGKAADGVDGTLGQGEGAASTAEGGDEGVTPEKARDTPGPGILALLVAAFAATATRARKKP